MSVKFTNTKKIEYKNKIMESQYRKRFGKKKYF